MAKRKELESRRNDKSKKQKTSHEQRDWLPALSNEFALLRDKGWQVIPDVLTREECKIGKNGIIHYLENLGTGFVYSDPRTWKADRLPLQLHGSMIQYAKVSMIQEVCDLRTHPAVATIFSRLWQIPAEDLLVSPDAISVGLPPELKSNPNLRRWAHNQKPWLHCDQDSTLRGACCVQGFLTLEDINEQDMCLIVLEQSHKYHDAFLAHFGPWERDEKTGLPSEPRKLRKGWLKYSEDEIEWLRAQVGVKEIRVTAKAGSLVLWDSRTSHQGSMPMQNRSHPTPRFVVYVCMGPRDKLSAKDYAKRMKYWQAGRVMDHGSFYHSRAFPENQRYGIAAKDLNLPKYTPELNTNLARRLIGFRSESEYLDFKRYEK